MKKEVFEFQKRLREDQLRLKLEDQLSKDTENKDREKQVQEVYGLILQHKKSTEGTQKKDQITGLNEIMTFDNYVTGPSNEFAVAASQMVSKNPSGEYNPLFLTSGAGLGKTHLLNAIGNQIRVSFPDKVIKYITCESFTDRLIKALKDGALQDFRDECTFELTSQKT